MSDESCEASPGIGLLNESPLHAALKEWYAGPGDRFEVTVDGFVVDIVQDNLLVEIQTGNFAAIKGKMTELTASHPVRLVYPIAEKKWIVKRSKDGSGEMSRRKSPKQGQVEEVFWELVSFPQLLRRSNFSLEVVMIWEEEVRRYDGKRRWWRRGWVTEERRLLEVVGRQLFETERDMGELIPSGLDEPFTTAELGEVVGGRRRLGEKMAYCLRKMGVVKQVGKRGRANLYVRAAAV
jgi:hypothetical protein